MLHFILSFLKDVGYFWRLEIILKGKEWFMCYTCELLHAPNTLLCITCQLMYQPFYQCSRQDLKELFPTKTSLWIFQIFSPGIWYYQVWQCAAHGEKKIHPALKCFSCPLYQSFFAFVKFRPHVCVSEIRLCMWRARCGCIYFSKEQSSPDIVLYVGRNDGMAICLPIKKIIVSQRPGKLICSCSLPHLCLKGERKSLCCSGTWFSRSSLTWESVICFNIR